MAALGINSQPEEKKEPKFEVIRPDDIWLMKDADDFLRYLKFEAINYGYLFAHLFMAIYLLAVFNTVNCKMMNSFVVVMLVWRVIDIAELHYIEAYDEDTRVLIAKNVLIMLTLIVVMVLYIMNRDTLFVDEKITSSRWIISELICGLVF